MKLFMTILTSRNNVKPMFWFISFVMMILFCLQTARTFESFGFREFAVSYGLINGAPGFLLFGVFLVITPLVCLLNIFPSFALAVTSLVCLTFFALVVLLQVCFVVFRLGIRFYASLTGNSKAIFCTAVFVKVRQWFSLLAVRTSFCYDLVSHICSPKQVWSEPFTRPILVCGSSYYNDNLIFVKGIL